MNKLRTWKLGILFLFLGGVLVLFTDIEVHLVRWVNCGPMATTEVRISEICIRE